jgi:hypothetical protein
MMYLNPDLYQMKVYKWTMLNLIEEQLSINFFDIPGEPH